MASPGGSREIPAAFAEPDSDDEEAPPVDTTFLDLLCIAADTVMKRDARIRYEQRLAEEAKYHKKIAKREEEEEDQVNGKGIKSLFNEAKEAIEKRRTDSDEYTSSSIGIELNLTKVKEVPTLMEMSLRVLADNSEAITSLNLVPDHLRTKLSNLVSSKRKLDTRFMKLLIQGSPSEISVKNCVDIEEKDLANILCDCNRVSLKVLNLDLCGRAMTENVITEFLKRSPNGFPYLTKLSLQGAFCLTNNGLALIARSAPLLRNINLSYCSYLTSRAVKILADNFGSTLRGLNIGGCQGIIPSNVFKRSLRKFEKLSYLSVAGLNSIHDVVAAFVASRGSNLTHLSLASCTYLNDGTMWTVGRCCPNLEVLDISQLDYLTDASLKEITNGCRSLKSVRFTRNRFSDEAVAAFLEVSGGSLTQLFLDHVRDVGQETALSLANTCNRLRYLDLSWCRKLTEEDLRRILSCCSLLRSLKLFGWMQVRDEFLEELSGSPVHIVGLKMTSLFAHLDDFYTSVDDKFF
ncbi:F-box/LRR-repeat protein 2 [Eutrema salsugineum]|uniref:F-box/LRR-repeat protein 2 n=1 Tax=Eutrema salsugineum TaxID=72664 RepID=UPI000CED53A3|nr:F-box/LRR-repeat protein 2 [Eutrema salsugineum]